MPKVWLSRTVTKKGRDGSFLRNDFKDFKKESDGSLRLKHERQDEIGHG